MSPSFTSGREPVERDVIEVGRGGSQSVKGAGRNNEAWEEATATTEHIEQS